MKQLVAVILFLITMEVSSQEKRINTKDFIGIEISRGLRTNLIHANENRVVVKGKNRDKVKIEVENGILKIKAGNSHLLESDNTVVDVYFKYILAVEARHNSMVVLSKKLRQPLLRLKAREGASIFAELEIENLVAYTLTGGSITVNGKADIQEVEVKSGSYRGENLEGRNINVVLNGGGNANINAKNYVNAMAHAGGHIYIYGNPVEIHEKTSFGGTIKKIN